MKPSKRDLSISAQLRDRASVCRTRGDYPSAKVMFQAASRLEQIDRESLPPPPNNATVEGQGE